MTPEQADFLGASHRGVFVTIKRNGRPQLSNIAYAFDGNRVRMSVTNDRAKTRNARRDARVALHVTDRSFGRYLVVEGEAEVAGPVQSLRDATSIQLEEVYRSVVGDHPDWDEFHQAMLDDQRAIIGFVPDHVYGTV
ncbi:MAG: PPOX class F420-dependent oxidoreductase [Acidimicrobiia bacterium]|nr:PPOX class F420-dependent oxidoreductase [Acidimicrobiia bacterium]